MVFGLFNPDYHKRGIASYPLNTGGYHSKT